MLPPLVEFNVVAFEFEARISKFDEPLAVLVAGVSKAEVATAVDEDR